MRFVQILVILAGWFLSPTSADACVGTGDPVTVFDFQGHIQSGESYDYILSLQYDLSFKMVPNDHGWLMVLEDGQGHDMIYPVTPPYRFNPLQTFDGSYGEKTVQGDARPFQFLYGLAPDEYKDVEANLGNVLRPKGDGDQEKGLAALAKFPKGTGEILILDAVSVPPVDKEDKRETVKIIKFKVHLEAPKGFAFDIPQNCTSKR